jgi:uncharacterized protein (TIGR02145 family)
MVLRFFILAVAFLLSCTGIERDSVCDEKSVKYNGCVGGVLPSSSETVPSSSSGSIVYGDSVYYEGETYATVVIGTQTWFQRNLHYAAPGSKCGNGSSLSDANTATCDTYGRLYYWATAMALAARCNFNSCASQINANHQGICPIGWHIPSRADWDELFNYVMSSNGYCDCAARYLKAAKGWCSGGCNGQDKYGFSALPGGLGYDSNYIYAGDPFSYAGDYGYWWTTDEHSHYPDDMAKTMNLGSTDGADPDDDDGNKFDFRSVRCLKN